MLTSIPSHLNENTDYRTSNEIIIRVDDIDEALTLFIILYSNGYDNPALKSEISDIRSFPSHLFVNLKTKIIFVFDKHPIEKDDSYKEYIDKSDTYEHVYEVKKDLATITKMLKNGVIIPETPNYTPRKLIRESFHLKYNYSSIVIGIMNDDDLPKIEEILVDFYKKNDMNYQDIIDFMRRNRGDLGVGEYIRIDRYNYFKKGDIRGIDGYASDNHFTYEKVFTLKDLENGLLDNIFKRGISDRLEPTYKPRKIDRTLESTDNKIYESKVNDELLQTTYFQKYNIFIMGFDRTVDERRFDRLVQSMVEITGFDLEPNMTGYRIHCHDDRFFCYLRKYVGGTFGWGWDDERNFDAVIDDSDNYPKIFTIDEVDSKEKILSILRRGNVSPSYVPRKIDRTLENMRIPKNILVALNNSPWDLIILRYTTIQGMERTKDFIGTLSGISFYHQPHTGIVPCDVYIILRQKGTTLRRFAAYEVTPSFFDNGNIEKGYPSLIVYPIPINMDESSEEVEKLFNDKIFKSYPDYSPKRIDKNFDLNETVVLGMAPCYKPRRIDRTLENLNPKYNYSSIVINIKDDVEFQILYEELIEFCDKYNINNYDINNFFDGLSIHSDVYIRIRLNYFSKLFLNLSWGFMIQLDSNTERQQQTYEKVFTIDDIKRGLLDSIYLKGTSVLAPSYAPRKIIKESLNTEKVLWAFDMDDTLVYSTRFEEHVKPLLVREFLTPQIILQNKIDDIGIKLNDLKYADGRIYFDDPQHKINITDNSSWTRKGDRVYITQSDAYYLTSESMPIGVHEKIVDIYNKAEYKAIVTSRRERLKKQTELALKNLGIKKPNYGLFMYPSDSLVFQAKWKAFKLLDLYKKGDFTELHYFDDNIKVLKKIRRYLKKKDINITLYKVDKNNYRKI
jgi:hypothetical protein